MLRHLREAYRRVVAGGSYSPAEVAEGVSGMSRSARAALGVAQTLMPSLTAGVIYRHNPLQRVYGDLAAARQHGTQNLDLTGVTLANLEMGNPAPGLFVLTSERHRAALERAERAYG